MVRIYSIPDCPYCKELKDKLTEANIQFIDVDINEAEGAKEFDKVNKIANTDSVPVVKVGKQILVPEVSFKSITEAFELTKRFLGS